MEHTASESPVPEVTCRDVAAWTSTYLDEHLDDDRKLQIALHLAVCAGCETYVQQIASVRNLVRLLPKTTENPAGLLGTMPASVRSIGKHR
jgi:predicted anti-sigma-YlaC factor YlaD